MSACGCPDGVCLNAGADGCYFGRVVTPEPVADDHPPCCTSCGGKGGTYSGPCWDCQGTGHAHPPPEPVADDRLCNCAYHGHARLCPVHTQEDFDMAEANREGVADDRGRVIAEVLAAERCRDMHAFNWPASHSVVACHACKGWGAHVAAAVTAITAALSDTAAPVPVDATLTEDELAVALHSVTCDDNPGHADWVDCATTGPCRDEAHRMAAVLGERAAPDPRIEKVRVLLDAAEFAAETSLSRDFNGNPFMRSIPTTALRAVLDDLGETL